MNNGLLAEVGPTHFNTDKIDISSVFVRYVFVRVERVRNGQYILPSSGHRFPRMSLTATGDLDVPVNKTKIKKET